MLKPKSHATRHSVSLTNNKHQSKWMHPWVICFPVHIPAKHRWKSQGFGGWVPGTPGHLWCLGTCVGHLLQPWYLQEEPSCLLNQTRSKCCSCVGECIEWVLGDAPDSTPQTLSWEIDLAKMYFFLTFQKFTFAFIRLEFGPPADLLSGKFCVALVPPPHQIVKEMYTDLRHREMPVSPLFVGTKTQVFVQFKQVCLNIVHISPNHRETHNYAKHGCV